MNFCAFFIRRPVATILLIVGISLVGVAAYFVLPVASLPTVDFPTIQVRANQPGASPDVMATSVATPLERHLGNIADITEMTSQSQLSSTNITLQFGLDRDINGAARDVQAAINAAVADLPTAGLRSLPSYNKSNPADQPIIVLNVTSKTLTNGQIYDAAATILQQKLSQVQGVGEVDVQGGTAPAVRIELNPRALTQYGIAMEDVRAAVNATNANVPKGFVEQGDERMQVYTNDPGQVAADYRDLVIGYHDGAPVRLSDVAGVIDSVENTRNMGLVDGHPAMIVQITRVPGANIIATVDRIKALLPELKAALPANVDLGVSLDRTVSIRASIVEVERTLMIAIILVVIVVLVFLRNGRATIIPAVAVVVSLLGTLGIMYVLGYSLDNLSLMALTVATGFVVDDAIVVLENITRHVEEGVPRFKAALLGAREVAFTVVSMTISLIAVFIPILLMAGIVGRLFREFAVTLSAAILFSLLVSLTATPMMAARMIDEKKPNMKTALGRVSNWIENRYEDVLHTYEDSLNWALNHRLIIVSLLFLTIGLNVFMYLTIPKGFFPQQDTGILQGFVQVDQASSFALTSKKVLRYQAIISQDPAVDTVTGFTSASGGNLNVVLKPEAQRPGVTGDMVINRLRSKMQAVPGAQSFLQSVQDIRIGGRQSNAQYQYTLLSDSASALQTWAVKLADQLNQYPALTDVNTNQEQRALETYLTIDHDSAARLGVTPNQIDTTLNDAFGQALIATIYNPLNQYHVVMEVAPQFAGDPQALNDIYVQTGDTKVPTGGAGVLAQTTGGGGGNLLQQTGSALATTVRPMVPLSAISHYELSATARSVNHTGTAVSTTISFNLAPGKSLTDAQAAVHAAEAAIGMPNTVIGSFSGTAQAAEESFKNTPILILTALLAVYIVLGILYESYIHPLTVLSTLPSAGVGAVGALMLFHVEFSLISLIGVILLIGIVKKNAIMIIDFALQGERDQGLSPRDAIYRACMLRFRPIMMTTFAAVLGALPLAIGMGEGGELRRPLGIAIIGGLIVSQVLTLITTPVVYLYLDKLRRPSSGPAHSPRWLSPSGPTVVGHAAPSKD